ncbi:hypothetical protein [Bradyrhizobium sp. CCBAU 51627]|nr:hypothetical protein [Bradyrhizobium sp. CCBAU 51627]
MPGLVPGMTGELNDRRARIFDNFNALDALRKDIGGIFSTIRNSLNRIG